jgi:hypothetical protein
MRMNKHIRMIMGILAHPFKIRRSYYCLSRAAEWRAEQKRCERDTYMTDLLKK